MKDFQQSACSGKSYGFYIDLGFLNSFKKKRKK